MQTHLNWLWAGLLAALLLTSCGGPEEEKKDKNSIASNLASALKEMQEKGSGKTIDFHSLMELLPAEAGGLARKEATGGRNGDAGFKISTATGKYASADSTETIELTLIDGGGSMMTMGLAAWSMIEVDEKNDNGYEKTGTIDDNKSFEKYDNASKKGEIAVLVNKQFLVTAKGQSVSMDKLKAALNDVDLDKLSDLK